jgi:hypothetical protein
VHERRRGPVSLGERLDVVAFVTSSAAAIVLAANVVAALLAPIGQGAGPSPVRERIILAAQPANVGLGVVVLLGAAALTVRRWLGGDHATESDALSRLVFLTSAAVGGLAVVGMFAEVLWLFDGASWGARVASIGNHTAAAALGALACWLVAPNGP